MEVLPAVRGLDVIELGCGTAYFSAWLKRLGARRVVGVDVTPAQLATAQELNREFGLGLERTVGWICGIHHIREAIAFPRTMNRLKP